MNRNRDVEFPKNELLNTNLQTKKFAEKICENCDKADVCKYQDECMKAVEDILDIESRTNVFIRTHIDCKKWSKKSSDVAYR